VELSEEAQLEHRSIAGEGAGGFEEPQEGRPANARRRAGQGRGQCGGEATPR
ncbi:hypothetical protein pipiens_020484, partial [Culex pipiens pipiens]